MGALVEKVLPEATVLTLVNTNQLQARSVTVQTGAYAEHQCTAVEIDGQSTTVGAPYFVVRLAPGAGTTMKILTKRYAHRPTLSLPWDRAWMVKN